MFNIVLVEPEIPANTGNVARTCSVTGCSLHLVEPLGFSIDDRQLKRAGLDYWHLLDVHIYRNIDEFLDKAERSLLFLATTSGGKRYTDVFYPPGAFLVFGKETRGLPDCLLGGYPDRTVRIPMRSGVRSLNLSNSVAILVYEAFRQNGFTGLR
ncbi:MAG: tRNA (cytidine(34)-2'-O)-methyltransferase [Peptococcaceae bacterium]|jgi:tRNA (cytidine/uridine-2'-O-)-methyltransferase|nr:tRNA (cytidine(34)-2'-O)-methyltransferase [Peptococcaceae bacterium]MDH7525720.1 tRNA (cytidine(34)-2'-O)-methyltransferase [Peptococcaceae bacterium]